MTSRDRLLALMQEHPNATLRELGDMLGVSYQRVEQLLKALGIPPKSRSHPKPRTWIACAGCKTWFLVPPGKLPTYCSVRCSSRATAAAKRKPDVVLTCAECGTEFTRRHRHESMRSWRVANVYKSNRRFCTSLCANRYNFGKKEE